MCTGATVPFIELVNAITPELIGQLQGAGYDTIEIQYGHAYDAFMNGPGKLSAVEGFSFDQNIRERLSKASLVISHAGTGSILDALRSANQPKRLMVVVNENLMDNHQREIADKLATGKHLMVCTPQTLGENLSKAFEYHFEVLPPPVSLTSIIDEELQLVR